MQLRSVLLILIATSSIQLLEIIPLAFAQSIAARERGLFDLVLMIGIVVGIVVFGLLFYAVIRYREKSPKVAAK